MLAKMLRGATAGLVATAPMTIVMEVLFRRLPRRERYPLPPSEITAVVEHEAGVSHEVDRDDHLALTLINHFGYGAASGAGYGLIANALPLPPALRGISYGLAMWVISYLGWLPALGILHPATEHPGRRNALMIASHIVYGATLGLLFERLERRR
jgi:uncharacterized membrane protein YagU involved in acid resistance